MPRINRPIFSGCALLSFLGAADFCRADVVYQNTDYTSVKDYVFSHEYGDEIALAGTFRDITKITIQYYAQVINSVGASATVQIYDKTGPLADPTSPSTAMPGKLLWQSPSFTLNSGLVTSDISLSTPIDAPDTIIWTIKFAGINYASGDGAGLVLAGPPTIGGLLPGAQHPVIGSYADFWVKQNDAVDDSWALQNFGFGPTDPAGNFYITVQAIPEPGTLALGLVGAAALFGFAKTRRR